MGTLSVFVFVESIGLKMATATRVKRRREALGTENRSIELALQPMLSAERDRAFLKHIVKSRDWEADLMKDVPGWEVGTFYGKPVYKTLRDDELDNKFHYYSLSAPEIFAHSDRHQSKMNAYNDHSHHM